LESALARCFDASEKKSAESITEFKFSNNNLTLLCKGGIAFYKEQIPIIDCDEDCAFSIKTNILLEFVKYISAEEVVIGYDSKKQTCLVSSVDKKSKIALQALDHSYEWIESNDENIIFDIKNPQELISKLMFASRFCSNNFQEHPLTAINCNIEAKSFKIRATTGPAFYGTAVEKDITNPTEIYLPKKAPIIIKNIFSAYSLKKCYIASSNIKFESDNCSLIIYLEKTSNDSFPSQITDWSKKKSIAKIKVSSFELSKTLKFFNMLFSESAVKFVLKNGSLDLECKENTSAAKENVPLEEFEGEAESAYNSKILLDCLESLQATWVHLEFITMQDNLCLCKLYSGNTLELLCPVTTF
jgi:DNA polymerase III sliding clamp (beta) subunit (PCNA family)